MKRLLELFLFALVLFILLIFVLASLDYGLIPFIMSAISVGFMLYFIKIKAKQENSDIITALRSSFQKFPMFVLIKVKKLRKIKINTQVALLVLILLLVSIPYLQSSIKSFKIYRSEQKRINEQKQLQIKLDAQKEILNTEENKRLDMLAKYGITVLEKIVYKSPFTVSVPDKILSYLLGELKDAKLGSEIECRLSGDQTDKYKKYCPQRYYGICSLSEWSKAKGNTLSTPSPYEMFIADLKKSGYQGPPIPMDKCERLNYQQTYLEFDSQISKINRMIDENQNDEFIKQFVGSSFNNYLILKSELKL